MSNSNEKLGIKEINQVPTVTPRMWKEVSDYRKDMLQNEVMAGKFSVPGGNNYVDPDMQKTAAGNVLGSSNNKGFQKSAQFSSSSDVGSGASGWRGSQAGGSFRQVPQIYSPLWLNSNLNLPRDRATINAWCRSFFALNPVVQNAVSLHSTYPISKLNIRCENAKVKQFFEDMIEEIDLMSICSQIAQEYWTLGEAFVYGELDERSAKWSRLLIQNPDYMVVKRSVVAGEPIVSLKPDENLRRICLGNSPSDVQQRAQLDESIIEHVKRGENIPLSNFYVSHLARRISPYEIRGTSLIVSCFRSLMLFDRLRESKFAQADDMINPLSIIKIGGGADGFKPTPADLEQWRDIFEQATYDPNFKIFTHDAVSVERVGYNQGILDTSNDITQLLKEIYIGLMVPLIIIEGGGDITYANGGVTLDVLKSRYMQFRNMIASWLRRKIFAPISKINEFYELKDGKKNLIVPEVEWNHMSLFDAGDYIQNISQLATSQPRNASLHTLYKSLGLDYEEEQRKIRKENIDFAIQQKEMDALTQMNLDSIRSLEEGDEIREVIPMPGNNPFEQSSGSPLPGEGGAGLGFGAPPMSGGPEGGMMPGGIPSPPAFDGGPPTFEGT